MMKGLIPILLILFLFGCIYYESPEERLVMNVNQKFIEGMREGKAITDVSL